ncbi:MAG TPA: anti-sigma factor antagonist [Actinobacteria bacterium]|nr:anti-sigma factor antagonist [Actinomycetota bacterium]
MSLQVSTKLTEGIPVIDVEGQVDMGNYIEVHELILAQVEEGHPNIVLNFRKLSFMDSATLGMLLRSLDKAKQSGGLLVIVSNPFVDRVLAVTGLTHLFELFTNEDEALARLLSKAS